MWYKPYPILLKILAVTKYKIFQQYNIGSSQQIYDEKQEKHNWVFPAFNLTKNGYKTIHSRTEAIFNLAHLNTLRHICKSIGTINFYKNGNV